MTLEFQIAAPRITVEQGEPQPLPEICPPIARDYRDDHPIYDGPYDVEPGPLDIMLLTSGKLMTEPVLIHAVAAGAVYETGTWTPSQDVARGEISFANAHTDAPVLIALCDATNTNYGVDNTNYTMIVFDTLGLFNVRVPRTTGARRGMSCYYSYHGTTSTTAGGVAMAAEGQSGAAAPDYWTTNVKFFPYTNSDTRYWRSERTYKWIAIWKP